ncbi:MAG TPA: hypothetical protein VHL14_15205 [Steroidobacteraceae bacterium]|jgi:hypothetical protein|nr:hypothetical protein [Steroidobacteraceae bacterium]
MHTVTPYDVFNHANPASVKERRDLIKQEEAVVRAERNRQLEAQRSMSSPAGERIRLWEKLHKLHLPRNAEHKLLSIIATETGLNVTDIQREQMRRNASKAAAI